MAIVRQVVAPPVSDLTATATLILAGITLALAVATVALVWVTRAGTAQARADAKAELQLLRRQLGAGHRPLLVDVLIDGPILPDMGASESPEGKRVVRIEIPQSEPQYVDPRAVYVGVQFWGVFVSVPIRNVGRGLAVIYYPRIMLEGVGIGWVRGQTASRYHVPVGETTRVELHAGFLREARLQNGNEWMLAVPYTDFAGDQRTIANLRLVLRGPTAAQGPWRIEGVDQESPDFGQLGAGASDWLAQPDG
jgi:hypothetical protein